MGDAHRCDSRAYTVQGQLWIPSLGHTLPSMFSTRGVGHASQGRSGAKLGRGRDNSCITLNSLGHCQDNVEFLQGQTRWPLQMHKQACNMSWMGHCLPGISDAVAK